MEYLHLFKTLLEHDDAYYAKDGYQEPWVAYIENDNTVTYNKSALPIDGPIIGSIITFINNCNSEEYAYFTNLKGNSNTSTVNDAERKAFNCYYVTHTISGNTITFTRSLPTDEMGCFSNQPVSLETISGKEIFVDNGDGTYTQTNAWELTDPTIGPVVR